MGMIALVRLVIAASTAAGSILKVAGSISTKTGFARSRQTASAVAKKVKGDVITSSPGWMRSAISASRSASDPEAQPTAYEASQYAAISFSNSATSDPRIKLWLSKTRRTAASNSGAIFEYCAERSRLGTFVETVDAIGLRTPHRKDCGASTRGLK